MLVNNEVGTIQPLAEVAERSCATRAPGACSTPTPCRPSRGSTSPSAAAGADLVAISAHKFGGPKGVGALVVRDGVALEPLLEGGGQERGLRVGHGQRRRRACGMATALRVTARAPRAPTSRASRRLRDRLARRPRRGRRRRVRQRRPGAQGRGQLPRRGSAASRPRRCSWRSTAPACARRRDRRARRARPSRRTCSRRWGSRDDDARDVVPASASAPRPPTPTSTARSRSCHARRAPARRRRRSVAAGARCSVMVAMSGGVDSSVAAALLVEAGHDVTGVTLRLWGGDVRLGVLQRRRRRGRAPRRRAARPPALRLQLRRRVRRARRGAVRRRVRRRRDAEPVRRVQPAPQVRSAARAGRAPRVRRVRHRPPRRASRQRPTASFRLVRGADAAKDQSYVLVVLSQRELAPHRCSRSASSPRPRCGRTPPRLGLRTADKPESMDVCFVARVATASSSSTTRVGPRPRRRSSTSTGGRRSPRRHRAVHDRSAPRPRRRRRRAAVRRRRRRRDRTVTVGPPRTCCATTSRSATSRSSTSVPAGRRVARGAGPRARHAGARRARRRRACASLEPAATRRARQVVALYDGDVLVGGGIAA